MQIKKAIDSFNLFDYLMEAGVSVDVNSNGAEYMIECPDCLRKKLWIVSEGEKKGLWHCFRCNAKGNLFSLMARIEGITPEQAFKRTVGAIACLPEINQIEFEIRPDKSEVLPSPQPVVLPYNYSQIYGVEANPAREYALKRGLTDEDMKQFDLRYSASEGRLVFPVYFNGEVVGWQGRDITGKSDIDPKHPKALTGPSKKTGQGFKKSWMYYGWDRIKNAKFVTVVEGPLDAIKGKKANSIALFGKEMSEIQFRLLFTLKNLKVIFIGLDPEAVEERAALAKKLMPFFEVRMVPVPQGRDFGDSTADECVEYIKQSVCFENKMFLRF